MTVYRIQPQGAVLHGIETEASDGSMAGGVHVFGSLGELVACGEWYPESRVELVEIECQARDLRQHGDYEGVTLVAGRGQITRRRTFRDTRRVSRWALLRDRS